MKYFDIDYFEINIGDIFTKNKNVLCEDCYKIVQFDGFIGYKNNYGNRVKIKEGLNNIYKVHKEKDPHVFLIL